MITEPVWTRGQPAPVCHGQVSWPAALLTAMILLDYRDLGHATPDPWPAQTHAALSARQKELLRDLRPLVAHGLILRNFCLEKLPRAHPAHADPGAFLAWWRDRSLSDVAALIREGIGKGLSFYREAMAPIPEVEEYLRKGDELSALLATWGDKGGPGARELAEDPEAFQEAVGDFLGPLGEKLYPAFQDLQRGMLHLPSVPTPAEEAILQVTGLLPPAEKKNLWEGKKELSFYPVPHLAGHLSLEEAGNGRVLRIFFTPLRASPLTPLTSTPRPWELLGALGDEGRWALVEYLSRFPEAFAGQMAQDLGLHPSTVSRHLSVLERLGLVRVRREGAQKRYRLETEGVVQAISHLEKVLSVHEGGERDG